MKNFLKQSLVIFTMLISFSSITSLATTAPTYAETTTPTGPNCRVFLGMTSWDCNTKENPDNQDDLVSNVELIIGNILKDIAVIAAYLALGFIVYGGYLYIFSSGDVSKVSAGKKTLTHAFIGLAIAGLSNIIFSAMQIAIMTESGAFENCNVQNGVGCVTDPGNLVVSLFQWIIGVSGVVAAIFVVVGGIGYMTSAGDSGKLQKAKTTIIYALIGLIIVALSEAALSFIASIINNADSTGDFSSAIQSILNSIIGIAGIVAAVFVVIGGYYYITSAGDPGKIQKAKSTILYACIGLVVCGLAFAIVNFTIKAIQDSDRATTSDETSLLEKPIAFLEEKL